MRERRGGEGEDGRRGEEKWRMEGKMEGEGRRGKGGEERGKRRGGGQ